MNSLPTLITIKEVELLSGIDGKLPTCGNSDIYQVEQRERRRCIGNDFYDALVADLANYSAATQYEAGTEYVDGDTVIYNGLYYTATTTTTNAPSNHQDWTYADKFNEADYNTFWGGFLGPYLAVNVLAWVMPFAATKVASQGVVRNFGENFQSASASDMKRLQAALNARIVTVNENMREYLKDQTENTLFALHPDIEKLNSTDCGCECGGTGQIEYGGYVDQAGIYIPYTRTCDCNCRSCRGDKRSALNTYGIG
jgi:hypothetical protein